MNEYISIILKNKAQNLINEYEYFEAYKYIVYAYNLLQKKK